MKLLILVSFLMSVAQAQDFSQVCRLKAADQVLLDLNKNGRLWSSQLDSKTGDVSILVEGGKVWLQLADEEVYYCNTWSDDEVCVDYKFKDPETQRVEHQVQMEVHGQGCILRSYQNVVGARPWR